MRKTEKITEALQNIIVNHYKCISHKVLNVKLIRHGRLKLIRNNFNHSSSKCIAQFLKLRENRWLTDTC